MTAAIIQARVRSSRLPGKVLRTLGRRSVLGHVIDRAFAAKVDEVIVATTIHEDDDAVVYLAEIDGVDVVRGPTDDVLARYAMAASKTKADVLVRLTADCPLLAPEIIASVARHIWGPVEYSSNVHPKRTYPDGLDVEAFSRRALLKANEEAVTRYDREHVGPWMQRNCVQDNLSLPDDKLAHLRWTIDFEDDFAHVERLWTMVDRIAPGVRAPGLDTLLMAHRLLSIRGYHGNTVKKGHKKYAKKGSVKDGGASNHARVPTTEHPAS